MKIIVITSPTPVKDECCICNSLFEHGLELLHLRKPGYSKAEYEKFICQIKPQYRSRIVLHDHYGLVSKYPVRGIHLKSGEGAKAAQYAGVNISISCHSIEEIQALPFRPSYCFLSPIFDSISKPGYIRKFQQMPDLSKIQIPVIALGGITPERLTTCRDASFQGVAVLGYIWHQATDALNRFLQLRTSLCQATFQYKNNVNPISITDLNLQYITAPKNGLTCAEQIEAVCQGGVRWVQLRMKDNSMEEFLQESKTAKEICHRNHTLFIVNDSVEIAKQVDADGVHLGKTDMDPPKARKILGHNKIIGATCNSWEDILLRQQQQVDYIGLGPFAFTTTKKNLSPLLGLEGYQQLLQKMRKHQIHIPVFAIGGIRETDILPLMKTGIQGIALSGLIKNSEDLRLKSREILHIINQSVSYNFNIQTR